MLAVRRFPLRPEHGGDLAVSRTVYDRVAVRELVRLPGYATAANHVRDCGLVGVPAHPERPSGSALFDIRRRVAGSLAGTRVNAGRQCTGDPAAVLVGSACAAL